MRTSGFTRWAALTGALFVVLWATAYLILGGTVESSNSDAEISAYFADEGQRARGVIALFVLLGASLPFIVFLAVLRARLAQGEDGAAVWATAALGAGLVSTALWLVAATLYVLPYLEWSSTGEYRLDLDTYRVLSNAGFIAWVSAGTIMSILVLAASVLGIRARVIPRWLSWVGFAVAVSLLASFLVVPVIVLLVWLLAVSITLVWRRSVPESPPAAT